MTKRNANTQLRKIPLDKGGYEYGCGKYYGHGMPLYRFIFDNGKQHVSETFRAADRELAKALTHTTLKSMGLEPVFFR